AEVAGCTSLYGEERVPGRPVRAQAVVHLATAPKSNRVAAGIWNARKDAREGPSGEVPTHLRDAHYQGARSLGHGKGYAYPHDDRAGWVPQQYLPESVAGRRYYDPSEHGAEAEVRRSMERLREPGEEP
ncbi:MAG: hypothetical protein ACRDY7_02780, partial [Acidimicrobiia bacterium]